MNRLMKAEFYRVNHSSGFLKWIVMLCGTCFIMPFLVEWDLLGGTVTRYIEVMNDNSIIFIPMLLTVLASVIAAMPYSNKTAYYEIMSGHKTSHIILSKVVAIATYIVTVQMMIFFVVLLIMGMKNGMGDIKQIGLRAFLFMIVVFHYCSCGVLIATSLRHIVGAVLAFMRVEVFESMFIFSLQILAENSNSPEGVLKLLDWCPIVQLGTILGGTLTNRIIAVVCLSFLMEFIFWYLISYIGMKKKKYQ